MLLMALMVEGNSLNELDVIWALFFIYIMKRFDNLPIRFLMCLRDNSDWFDIRWLNSCDFTWCIKLLLQSLSILIKIWQ